MILNTFLYYEKHTLIQVKKTMSKIEITLSENISGMLYEDYELKKEDYDSFEDYMLDVEKYINLKLMQTNLKAQLEELDAQINELEN